MQSWLFLKKYFVFNPFFFSSQGLTAYHDISLDKCYITELNTSLVMPPRNLWELLINVKVRHFPMFQYSSCSTVEVRQLQQRQYEV